MHFLLTILSTFSFPPSFPFLSSSFFFFFLILFLFPLVMPDLLVLAWRKSLAPQFSNCQRIYLQELYYRPLVLVLIFIFVLFVSCLVSRFWITGVRARRRHTIMLDGMFGDLANGKAPRIWTSYRCIKCFSSYTNGHAMTS